MPARPTPPRSRRARTRTVQILIEDEPIVALTPLEGRVRVGLAVPGLTRVIDVSVQPSAACRALNEAARIARLDTAAIEASTREAIASAAEISDGWLPDREMPLSAAFGGIAFPLLGAAYDAGASPVDEVPRWAEGILESATFGHGAVVAFGDRATRPVKRALVEAVRPITTGQIALGVLALALMGREVLQPDRLARVLSCDRVLHPTVDLPDPSTLQTARRAFNHWGDLRTERVLVEAAARPDGLRLLLNTVRYALQLGDHGPASRLPNRLSDLHDTYRVLVPTASERQAAPPRRRRAARRHATPAESQAHGRAVPHPVLAPRSNLRSVPPGTPIALPAKFRSLDGAVNGDLTFVVPRTVGDLDRWGRLLSNCLADFGPSVTAGRSFIIGVERERRLIYAIEVTDRGMVRQFNGRTNRAPTDRDRRVAIAALVQARAINPNLAANEPWLAGINPQSTIRFTG